MANRDYGPGVWSALITLSRGGCYWPGCGEAVILMEHGVPVLRLEIAHITALNKTGARYDPNMTDDERNSFANLILLCTAHHKIVDRIEPHKFSVETLRKWKADREADGVDVLAGLKGLTEDRLQEILTDSYSKVEAKLDDALMRFAEFDSEAAAVLSMLRNELLDGLPAGTLFNLEAAEMLSTAAQDLQHLQDTAEVLGQAADNLQGVEDVANRLQALSHNLSSLDDTATRLEQVVEDLKHYGGNF